MTLFNGKLNKGQHTFNITAPINRLSSNLFILNGNIGGDKFNRVLLPYE